MIPSKLELGEAIGIVAPSDPIVGDNRQELEKAKEIVEKSGFQDRKSVV